MASFGLNLVSGLLMIHGVWGLVRSGSGSFPLQRTQRAPLSMKSSTLSEQLVNVVMGSPLRGPIVRVARNTMVKTAVNAGLPWESLALRLVEAMGGNEAIEQRVRELVASGGVTCPDYFQQSFHGYDLGNLEYMAAVEQELAGKAVGARNFPQSGLKGEEILRNSYGREIEELCGRSIFNLPASSLVVDLGCGTGTSSRYLARLFPTAKIMGIDLSPYMVEVGRFINSGLANEFWVDPPTEQQQRAIEIRYGDITDTKLAPESVSVASLSLVLHELPLEATQRVLREAARILKPGGVLLIMEMDPSSPGYVKLRNNAALFSLLRSTEPWLDEYFDLAPRLPQMLLETGFGAVKVSAATGRHFCIAATKSGGVVDVRPSDAERIKQDFHLNSLDQGKDVRPTL